MQQAILRISELLDATEVLRVLNGHPQTLPVLYVAGVVAYAGVEDVVQSMTAEEQVANHSQAFPIDGICPKSTKVSYCIYCLFLASHQRFEAGDRKMVEKEKFLDLFIVLLDPRDYPLSKIFRDIFRLVFKPLPLSSSSLSASSSGSSKGFILKLRDILLPFKSRRRLLLKKWLSSIWEQFLERQRVQKKCVGLRGVV